MCIKHQAKGFHGLVWSSLFDEISDTIIQRRFVGTIQPICWWFDESRNSLLIDLSS